MHEISLAAETLFSLGSFHVTNTMLVTLIITILLVVFAFFLNRKITSASTISKTQNVFELLIEGAFNLMDGVTGNRKQSTKFFPLVMTLFLFILLSNWSGLLPGVGPIGIYEDHHVEEVAAEEIHETETTLNATELHLDDTADTHEESAVIEEDEHSTEMIASTDEHTEETAHDEEEEHKSLVPLFRAPSSDLNMTLALAIISLFSFQMFGIMAIGFFKYASKFLNFKGPIDFFLGILELVAEIAKMISLSFRLFGNVFAGEVLLVVVAFLVPLVAPLPFFALEIFVGLIQAFIFAMLTLVFLKVATEAAH